MKLEPFHVLLTTDLHRKLKRCAKHYGRSAGALVRELIKCELREPKEAWKCVIKTKKRR
jgi:hypothetical protein